VCVCVCVCVCVKRLVSSVFFSEMKRCDGLGHVSVPVDLGEYLRQSRPESRACFVRLRGCLGRMFGFPTVCVGFRCVCFSRLSQSLLTLTCAAVQSQRALVLFWGCKTTIRYISLIPSFIGWHIISGKRNVESLISEHCVLASMVTEAFLWSLLFEICWRESMYRANLAGEPHKPYKAYCFIFLSPLNASHAIYYKPSVW